MKTKFVVLLVGAILLSGKTISQVRSGENVIIDKPVNDDLYVAVVPSP